MNNNTSPELTLIQYNLNETGTPVSLKGLLNVIEIDFGTGGIDNDASTFIADGYYAMTFALTSGQEIGSTHHFYRLLGDVNVNENDLTEIAAARGQSVAQISAATGQAASQPTPMSMNVNGDGAVNTIDASPATTPKNKGDALKPGLPLG